MFRSPSDKPRRAADKAFRPVGDEGGLVVLPERAEVKVLNPVGSRVFALIDGQRTIEEIVGQISREFDVSPDRARADVTEFLAELERQGMVVPGRDDEEELTS